MPGSVQLAVAGSGKTEEIVSRIKSQDPLTRSLALTFTVNGQNEIAYRSKSELTTNHETSGWMSFLVRHIIRPYLPVVFPQVQANALCFVKSTGEIPRWRSGWKYYFNDAHQPYSVRLAMLAKKVLKESKNAPIARLEKIFDVIYIDECQDLTPSDLVVVEALMKSSIHVFVTGDVRQSVLKTSKSDRFQQQYSGVEQVGWFRDRQAKNVCNLVFSSETRRFNSEIASFSDLIHDPALNFPPTVSVQNCITEHDGVFLLDVADVDAYVSEWNPLVLRYSKSADSSWPAGEKLNFGVSKGLTRNRTLIFTTGTIEKWLQGKELLKPDSACGFYVAATRARYSVALAAKNASKLYLQIDPVIQLNVQLWRPANSTSS